MSVKLRPVLASMPKYLPGKSFPDAVKLSSNETPYPPLPYVIEAVTAAAAEANRYPDTSCVQLTAALAAKAGLAFGQVAVGCGSVSLLTQLAQATADAGDEIIYAWRSFEIYPIIADVVGAVSVRVPLTAEHRHDLAAMAAAVTGRTRLIFLCSPNNPTGTAIGQAELREFLARVPADVVVVLDEAYREFVTDPDVPDGVSLLGDYPNLVVFRTFSKAYGLAGMRVGYAMSANTEIITAILQTQIPFTVTTVSQQAALASLQAPAAEQLARRVAEVAAERVRVRAALAEAGYEVGPVQGNFLWLPLGQGTAAFAAGCEQRGVIVRPFAPDGVRVTVSTPAENDRLLAAARELAANSRS